MDWGDIHIVRSFQYSDSTIIAEDKAVEMKRPVRSKEAPRFINRGRTRGRTLPQTMDIPGQPRSQVYNPFPDEDDDTYIPGPVAAIDGAPATDAEKAAQDALDEGDDDVPEQPPAMTRQTAEVPSTVPHIHSRLDFAPFAASAYEAPNQRESFMSDFTGRNAYYSYLPNNSNEEIAVYSGTDDSVVFAIRGTATAADAITDKSILTGNPLQTPRFRRNIQAINRIAATLGVPRDKIVLTGHSLGGSIAAAGAVALGVKAVTFNAGFSPASILRDPYAREGKYQSADIVNYTVPGDLVSFSSSMLPLLPETYTIQRTAAGDALTAPHKMSNFLNALGDWKTQRGDLYAPGARTEGRTRNVADGWISIPKRIPDHRKTKSSFTGGFGQPLPTPPTLWQVLTGREPPKSISDADRIARAASTARDLTNVLRPPRLNIPRFGQPIGEPEPYPELNLGPEEELGVEEAIEDLLGLGESAAEMGLLP